jgi:hypothetical protein
MNVMQRKPRVSIRAFSQRVASELFAEHRLIILTEKLAML